VTEEAKSPLVAPFIGERYAPKDRLGALIAPPYDVIQPVERETLAGRDPHNIVHLILPQGGDGRYAAAAERFAEWREAGVLVADAKPSLTVLQQEFTTPDGQRRARTGVIGAVAVEPFAVGRVKPHERTHAGPKEDRLALVRATRAMFEALLMVKRDSDGSLQAALAEATALKPLAVAGVGGVQNTLWRVTGRRAQRLAEAAGSEALYIADGHHRYETAIGYRGENPLADRIPAHVVAVNDPGMVVLPTHRIVCGHAVDEAAVAADLRERFQMRDLPPEANYAEELATLRDRGTACVMVLPGGRAVALLLKGGASLGDLPFANEPAVASLDVARIDEIVVKRLKAAAGSEGRIDYSADAHHVIDEVQSGRAAAGVLLNPTALEQVLSVADAGAAMPQKSTYFAPKVPSGLVIAGY
jgi:uncharacterized protein (DUF1015 family)